MESKIQRAPCQIFGQRTVIRVSYGALVFEDLGLELCDFEISG